MKIKVPVNKDFLGKCRIRFTWLEVKDFGFTHAKHLKVIFIALWWFGIQISYGKVIIDVIEWEREQKLRFNKNCIVCKKPLIVTSWNQVINYHKECRKLRKHV